ncbi:MAG: hypothetical protein U1F30_05710 [Steroidobacteraceae bacterium]
MSTPAWKARIVAVVALALCGHAIATAAGTAGNSAPPRRTRINSILQKHSQPAHPKANNHAPGKPATKRKTDQQLRAEVRAIERDGTGYISPARQRELDQKTGRNSTPAGH